MEEEKDGAGDAPPPVDASTDAGAAAPILMSKNAAKKAAKARAKAEAKAKARVEKGLDPHPPKKSPTETRPAAGDHATDSARGDQTRQPRADTRPRRCIAIDEYQEAAKIRGVQAHQQGQRSHRRG